MKISHNIKLSDNFSLNSLKIISEPSRIHISVVSGHTVNKWKTFRDKNHSGTYSFHSEFNNRPVYKVNFNI